MSELTDVIKLSKSNHKKLLAAGVGSIADLANAYLPALAEATGIDLGLLQKWQTAVTVAVDLAEGESETAQALVQLADVAPGGEENAPGEPVIHLLTGVKRG
jgi:hypothetical protein